MLKRKIRRLGQFVGITMLSLTLAALSSQIVEGRNRTVSLEETQCVGSGPGRWRADSIDVAIGRAVHKSVMNLSPSNGSATVTCRIRSENSEPRFQTLQLEFGMEDRDTASPPNIVNIYLDGQQVASRRIGPSQAASFLFNVSNISNVSIETTCASKLDYCSRVYFYKASLERIPDRPRR